jgi:hypothetical protein
MIFNRSKGKDMAKPAKDLSSPVLKYSKPKILLVDMEKETESILKGEGYNILIGSYGTPYEVVKSDNLLPVIINGNLPFNLTEQEIVVINLKVTSTLIKAVGNKVTTDGENDWWASCTTGLVDPRPRLMIISQDSLNKIYSYGGILIVFADYKLEQNHFSGRVSKLYGYFEKDSDI